MMKEIIHWGVLGWAGIARKEVIPAILKASNSEFFAIASRDQQKLEECSRLFPYKKSYSSYDGLLNDPEVDAIYIPLPNSLHKEWVIKAAQHKKHILCEKPLALTEQDCIEMEAACTANQVKLMEAFMYRYTVKMKRVTELLDSGIIGEIKHINSSFRFLLREENNIRMNAAVGGGSLWDVGCYPVNLIGMLLNDYPIRISAQQIVKNEVDIALSAVLKYESGILATLNCGFDSQSALNTEINGTTGTMFIPETFLDTPSQIIISSNGIISKHEVDSCERYVLEIEDFADAIINHRNPGFSLEETKRNVKLIGEILEIAQKA